MSPVRTLWSKYWAEFGLPGGFQGFEDELRSLPGVYSEPKGALAIAYADAVLAGTVALRPLSETACEAKRLYVCPEFRREGIARALMEWIISQARNLGYRTMYGDTLPAMTAALQMHRGLGFRIIQQAYSKTPTPGAIYLELPL